MTRVLSLNGADSALLGDCPFVVLPLGSIEYHGPHAALGTDTTLATGFADRVAALFDALVLPPIAYTFAPSITSGYRGTFSIAPHVFLEYLGEVLEAIVRNGAKRVLALNAHSENQYAFRLAAERLALRHPEASVLMVNWWKLVDEQVARTPSLFSEHGGHGHGGPLEISTAAAFDDAGVAPKMAGDIAYEPLWWKSAAQIVGRGQAPSGFAGYHGRVSEIDLAKGQELVDQVVRNLQQLVDDWLARIGV